MTIDIDETDHEAEAVEDAAKVVWRWTRHWFESRDWDKVPVAKKGRCRLIAWAVLATLKGKKMITQEVKLTAANAAIRRVCATWTYDGFNVGSRITDDQYDQVSYAVVSALDNLVDPSAPVPNPPTKAQKS